MSNQKDSINLSVQDTLRLIAKMLLEGHDAVVAGLSPSYLEEAADLIDALALHSAELSDRLEMYREGSE